MGWCKVHWSMSLKRACYIFGMLLFALSTIFLMSSSNLLNAYYTSNPYPGHGDTNYTFSETAYLYDLEFTGVLLICISTTFLIFGATTETAAAVSLFIVFSVSGGIMLTMHVGLTYAVIPFSEHLVAKIFIIFLLISILFMIVAASFLIRKFVPYDYYHDNWDYYQQIHFVNPYYEPLI